jgi:hypothetical protein
MATNPRIKPVERATNRPWDEWLRFMDGIGARRQPSDGDARRSD